MNTAVYKAFDATGGLLYVGVAKNWGVRWAQHAARSAFYATVARLDIEWCETRTAALARETALIRSEAPIHNVRQQTSSAPQEPARMVVGVCEVCSREPAYSFSWFPDRARWYEESSGTWKITGDCTRDTEHYYVLFDRWLQERDWLVHLRQTKRWFNELDFVAAVVRTNEPRLGAALRAQHTAYERATTP